MKSSAIALLALVSGAAAYPGCPGWMGQLRAEDGPFGQDLDVWFHCWSSPSYPDYCYCDLAGHDMIDRYMMTITKGEPIIPEEPVDEQTPATREFEVQGNNGGNQAALQTELRTYFKIEDGPPELRPLVMCKTGYSGVGCMVNLATTCPNGATRSGAGMSEYVCNE